MAKEVEGWLSREMGGSTRRWLAKLVAHTCLLRQLSGFESKHLSKYKLGDLGIGVANTL